jgi:cytochrome c553
VRRGAGRSGAILAALALLAGSAWAGSPQVDYALHCMGCHLDDGRETPGRIPALAGSMGRFLALPEGRAFLVRVPGSAQAPLDDAALAALLNWMLRRCGGRGGEETSSRRRLRRAPATARAHRLGTLTRSAQAPGP